MVQPMAQNKRKKKKHSKQLYMVKREKPQALVSASKLLGDYSGSIKMPTDFLNKTCEKRSKTEKVNITITFYIFEIAQVTNFSLK